MKHLITSFELIILVWGVLTFLKTAPGKKVAAYLPTPFWIYFMSILLSTIGVLPQSSPVYKFIGLYGLIAALFLMLIGTPIYSLIHLGPRAIGAMGLAMVSMFIGVISSFVLYSAWMPEEGGKMAGAMLGTWTGGSANLLSVKEVVGLSDQGLAPLIVADTLLSYGWLALLIMGVAYQKWFDRNTSYAETDEQQKAQESEKKITILEHTKNFVVLIIIAAAVASMLVILGNTLNARWDFLSAKAWSVLLVTTGTVLLALTPFQGLEEFKASSWGTFILYIVLATIGAKTKFSIQHEVGIVLVFGATALFLHGSILFGLGRLLKFPLFLLTTASQANVGGPVSAPIVAGVYKPGSAHVGVIMAILGAVLGTYIGAFGGWICQNIQLWIK